MLSKERINVRSLKEKLNKKGIDSTRTVERLTEQQKKRTLLSRRKDNDMEIENDEETNADREKSS